MLGWSQQAGLDMLSTVPVDHAVETHLAGSWSYGLKSKERSGLEMFFGSHEHMGGKLR